MKINRLFLLGASALVFVACSNELDVPVNSLVGESLTPLSINVSANPVTKAVVGQVSGVVMPGSSSIGVTLVKTGAVDGLYDEQTYNNIDYNSANGTTWTIGEDKNILLSATEGTVYAYYPYNPTSTDVKAIPIKATDNTDYMYATAVSGIKNSNPAANLTMNHALSVIQFKIQKATNDGYTGAGNITNVTIDGATLSDKGTMDITNNGAILATRAALSYNTPLSLTGTNTAEIFAVPVGVSSEITFAVTMDGQTYSATTTPLELEKGKQYAFTLNMTSTGLTVSQVNVVAWGDMQQKDEMNAALGFSSTIDFTRYNDTDYSVYINDVLVYNGNVSTSIHYYPGDVIKITVDHGDYNVITVDGNSTVSNERTFTATKKHSIEILAEESEIF